MHYVIKFLCPWILLLNEKKWWWLLILGINVLTLASVINQLLSWIHFLDPEMYYGTWFFIEDFIEDIFFHGQWEIWVLILWSFTLRLLCVWYIQYKNTTRLKIIAVILAWLAIVVCFILAVFGHAVSKLIDWIKT